MAQAKRAKYTSKGTGDGISRKVCNSVRRNRSEAEKILIKQKAWSKGQNPWLSVPNPNPNNTKERMVRVRANDYWGDPRAIYKMGGGGADKSSTN